MPPAPIKPILLVILDGFGCRHADSDNAITNAHKPNFDHFWKDYPHTLIQASEAAVGLPAGQMGNSEVGHLNIGAGRVVYQEFTRIERAIHNGHFPSNPALKGVITKLKANGGALHIFGLLSDGGVHSHENHIHAMLDLALHAGLKKVYVHAFLDGRDTPPKSAEAYIRCLQDKMDGLRGGQIASIVGRYFAMDRDKRWDRVKVAFDLLTLGRAEYHAPSADLGLEMAYARGETDEFVKPTAIVAAGAEPVRMRDGDAIVFMNFRSDRAREITKAFIEPGFKEFERDYVPKLSSYCTLTGYSKEFDVPVAFPPERVRNGFGEYIAKLGLRQLRIAETEKYPHVTFFFNGGREVQYDGESRIMVPSPKVATYDLQPEMSAPELAARVAEAIRTEAPDLIVLNFANPDMVGHTGVFEAAVAAIEAVDEAARVVIEAAREKGYTIEVIADHGNADRMRNPDGSPHTAHTTVPVPHHIERPGATLAIRHGKLGDVAPTILALMGLDRPAAMTGESLVDV